MSNILPAVIKSQSFRFSPLKCRNMGISLQAARFLRWLYLAPQRTNGQISATFGLALAWSMLDAGYVYNLLDQTEIDNTHLWSLTEKGVKLLDELIEVKS